MLRESLHDSLTDVMSWNATFNRNAMHGHGNEAISQFENGR
jgi:hypothetical protein